MRKIILILAIIVLGVSAVYYGSLQNEIKNLSIRPFTADVVQIDSEGHKKKLMKVYQGELNMRIDTRIFSGIFRADRHVIWVVPGPQGPHIYLEIPIKYAKSIDPLRMFSRFPRKGYVGIVLKDGQKDYKFIKIKGASLQIEYISTTNLVPVEIDKDFLFTKMILKIENVQMGEPPSSIFDVPDGYQKRVINNIGDLKKEFQK